MAGRSDLSAEPNANCATGKRQLTEPGYAALSSSATSASYCQIKLW